MNFDRKTIVDHCRTDKLQQRVDDLKSEKQLRAEFRAAADRADFLAMANGDEARAFNSFCLAAKKGQL